MAESNKKEKTVVTVEVDGIEVEVDKARLGSWDMFRLLKNVDRATGDESVYSTVEVIEYAFGAKTGEVIDKLRDENGVAEWDRVLVWYMKVVAAARAKN